jgi:hypothetical protein
VHADVTTRWIARRETLTTFPESMFFTKDLIIRAYQARGCNIWWHSG